MAVYSETFFKSLIDGLQEAVVVISPAGEVQYANLAAIRVWQKKFGRPLKPLDEVVSREKESFPATESTVLLGPVGTETGHLPADCRPLDKEGFYLSLKEESPDIVDSLEQQILHLEEAILNRDTLLSVVGHDLRAPIFQLNSLLFRLKQDVDRLDRERIAYYTADLEERIFYLTQTLENLLRWTSAQWTELTPQLKETRLHSIFEEVVGLFRPLLGERAIEVEIAGSKQTLLQTDREMLLLIFRNIISNAIKFSSDYSSIEISWQRNGDNVTVHIRDRGIGIDEAQIARILDAGECFTRRSGPGENGAGLGLKIVQQFASKMGIGVAIHSKPKVYTEFELNIPRQGPPKN